MSSPLQHLKSLDGAPLGVCLYASSVNFAKTRLSLFLEGLHESLFTERETRQRKTSWDQGMMGYSIA